jgi:hypothetical protein
MADSQNQSNEDKGDGLVALVTTDILTPYRKGEVFRVTPEEAEMLLTRSMVENDFGPRNEKVRVRKFNPETDQQLLLDNGVLNAVEHKKLQNKLRVADN